MDPTPDRVMGPTSGLKPLFTSFFMLMIHFDLKPHIIYIYPEKSQSREETTTNIETPQHRHNLRRSDGERLQNRSWLPLRL
jgi:hypothetical protein